MSNLDQYDYRLYVKHEPRRIILQLLLSFLSILAAYSIHNFGTEYTIGMSFALMVLIDLHFDADYRRRMMANSKKSTQSFSQILNVTSTGRLLSVALSEQVNPASRDMIFNHLNTRLPEWDLKLLKGQLNI